MTQDIEKKFKETTVELAEKIAEYLKVHRNSVSKWIKNPCTSAT